MLFKIFGSNRLVTFQFIFSVVEFRDPEHAKKAIDEYHQKKIKDRAIIVREVKLF